MVSKKAIILIPGFYSGLYDFVLDKLQKEENGFKSYEEIKTKDNSTIRQFNLEKCLVHIYELDYSEEIAGLYLNEWVNLLFSISLLFYWLKPDRIWLANEKKLNFFSYKTLAGGLLLPSLLFIYWYVFSLSFLLISIANILANSSVKLLLVISSDIKWFFNNIFFCTNDKISQHIFVWVLVFLWILSILFFPLITSGLEKAKFTKEYLESELLRIKIRNKVLKVLNAAIVNQDYTEVTIISHSFGVLIGADSIGHALSSSNKSIKFISLGNNLSFLSRNKYNLITGIIKKCISNLRESNKNKINIPYWIDYRSESDWLSTPIYDVLNYCLLADMIGIIIQEKKVYSKKIECLRKIIGSYHIVYFQNESYLREDQNKNISAIERIVKNQIKCS